jgi:hypothetical protein
MSKYQNEGLGFARLLMVLSSLTPLFILWAVRGVGSVPDKWLWSICGLLIVIPNLILWYRLRISRARNDIKTLVVGEADDHRDHLLVYLFAMLIPLYDANLSTTRDVTATGLAFVFIVFLFWHLNLHYMNLIFALFGYRVFTIQPLKPQSAIGGRQPLELLTKRSYLHKGQQIKAYRISNTVYFEAGVNNGSEI